MSDYVAMVESYVAARVREDGGCLRWTGGCANGHPEGSIGGKQVLIRRALYEAEHGPIPAGRIIRCTCETPGCVALEHLRLTTRRAVAQECGAKGLMSGQVRSARIAEAKRAGAQARITQEAARAIRCSDEPVAVLARRHGIAQATVSKIRLGQMRREFAGNPWAGLAP